MIDKSFIFARIPQIHFGSGGLKTIPEVVKTKGQKVLIISAPSFIRSRSHDELIKSLMNNGIECFEEQVSGEPSPELVDGIVSGYRNKNINVVLGVGGGSTIDAGKAVSAMMLEEGSVTDYLEGVGHRKHSGRKIPYIAVPTSSGTGSEATKNAVISRIGEGGFKKSLRHDNFIPDVAVVDPGLTLTCPPDVTAACGLDALTQLLESYVSTNSSEMTDALALSGLETAAKGFIASCENGSNISARENMSYAAMLSGMTLANAGLGVVHGFASPIGGLFQIPHGVVCGTLLGVSTRMNIEVLMGDMDKNALHLKKYSRTGEILSGRSAGSLEEGCSMLLETLDAWIEKVKMPKLGKYEITEASIPKIIQGTDCKYNPAALNVEQLSFILKNRM